MRKREDEELSVIDEDHESRSSQQRSGPAKRSSNQEEHLEAAAQSERRRLIQLGKAGAKKSGIEDGDNFNGLRLG